MIKLLKNNILKWIFGNYFTYVLSFISSIIVAKKLGVNLYGSWAEILLYISYITQLNFGITHSYFLSQITDVRGSENKQLEYLFNSLFIIILISLLFVLIFLFNNYFHFVESNLLFSYKIYYILFAAILSLINSLISNYYRLNNQINKLLIISLINPFVLIISSLFLNGAYLFQILVIQLVFTPLISLFYILYPIIGKFKLKISLKITREIFFKGIVLFCYNSSFYFIVLILRSFYNNSTSITEFGYFSFAMVLCNSIILFIDSASFIIQSKLLKENSANDNSEALILSVRKINRVFSTLATTLAFLFVLALPIFNYVIPEFKNSLTLAPVLLFCLTINYLSSGNVIFLMSKNKLFQLTISSILSLIICIIFLYLLKINSRVNFYPFAVFVSYSVFNVFTLYFVIKSVNIKVNLLYIIKNIIQYNIYIPTLIYFLSIVLNLKILILVSLILFVFFNFKNIKHLVNISINVFKN